MKVINKRLRTITGSLVMLLLVGLVACHDEDDIDFRAPSITVSTPTPGSNVSTSMVTITGTVSSDVVYVELSLEDDLGNTIGSPVAATLVGTSYSGSLTLSVGDNRVNAMARDAVGNRNTISFNLHYAQMSFSDGAAANFVIGQADFVSNDPNRGSTTTANSLSGVQGVVYEKELTVLYVPDTGNHRILGFNTIPTTDGADANFVLGQADLTSNSAGVSATEFNSPGGIYTSTTQLFVADSGNNRVLLWNTHPTNNTVAAAHVIGQLDFVSNAAICSSSTLSNPASVYVVGGKVIVLDKGNHRVLIWNTIPDADGVAADVVIGQSDNNMMAMTICEPNDSDGDGVTDTLSASTLNNPGGIWTDGERLLVADTGNHRVLVWDTFPATNGQAADWVIGQANMTSSANPAPPTNSSLNAPLSVTSNRVQIFVADSGNQRVLIFNNYPAANEAMADSVIGQDNFITAGAGTTATRMSGYEGVYVDRSRLFVVDSHRILIFNSL